MQPNLDLQCSTQAATRRRNIEPRSLRRMAFAIVGLVTLMAACESIGFMSVTNDQAEQNGIRIANRELRLAKQDLVDAETGVRGFLLTGRPEFLEPYYLGLGGVRTMSPELVDGLERSAAQSRRRTPTFSQTVGMLRDLWAEEVGSTARTEAVRAAEMLSRGKALMDSLRITMDGLLAARDLEISRLQERVDMKRNASLVLILLGSAMAVGALTYAFDRSVKDAVRRGRAVAEGAEATRRTYLLSAITDMLQSAADREDANDILRAGAIKLLPGLHGALYCFNNSRDRLDLSATWSGAGERPPSGTPDHIAPGACWAIKRGKPHRNVHGPGAVRCRHCPPETMSLEIPMAARGELYGLLELTASGEEADRRLGDARQIAGALADSMSLALSSIALREQLRSQALRDPLTGLYNRRFMEEMLARSVQDAEGRRAPLSAVMVDLDHFKKLNDQFGHAAGDAVLRQVATTIMAMLRGADVACRYGGEELAILMPDCGMDVALAKAEQVRAAIAAISRDGRVPPITASLGVASRPETAARAEDLLAQADAALYAAKQQGRDCVVAAALRPAVPALVLAGTG